MTISRITDLSVEYPDPRTGTVTAALESISLALPHGRITGFAGASGSGKSTLGRALLGLLPAAARVSSGRLDVADGPHLDLRDARRIAPHRGHLLGLVPQDPFASLPPLRVIGKQLDDALRRAGTRTAAARRAASLRLLREVGIDRPEARLRQYPHQLSGGQRQRVLIALALATGARIIVADEPTSALDATVRRNILDLLGAVAQARDVAVLLISHDLPEILDRSTDVYVLNRGRVTDVIRHGKVAALSPYGTALLKAGEYRFETAPSVPAPQEEPVITVRGLTKTYRLPGRGRLTALDQVDLDIPRGSFFGIVGESGSGKTTLGRSLLGLIDPDHGSVQVQGVAMDGRRRAAKDRRRPVQYVHQDPYGSLDPRLTIEDIVLEPLRALKEGTEGRRREVLQDVLAQVGLSEEVLGRRPRELSGGQRQRVAIARALALDPSVLVLDEAVSALDVIVQEQIITLLLELRARRDLTLVHISHDLRLVRSVADHVAVLAAGQIVDVGSTEQVFAHPSSDSTRALLDALPETVLHDRSVA